MSYTFAGTTSSENVALDNWTYASDEFRSFNREWLDFSLFQIFKDDINASENSWVKVDFPCLSERYIPGCGSMCNCGKRLGKKLLSEGSSLSCQIVLNSPNHTKTNNATRKGIGLQFLLWKRFDQQSRKLSITETHFRWILDMLFCICEFLICTIFTEKNILLSCCSNLSSKWRPKYTVIWLPKWERLYAQMQARPFPSDLPSTKRQN